METKICPSCKKEFKRPIWRKAIYCSYKCKGKVPWNKGKTKDNDERIKRYSGENHYLWIKDRNKLSKRQERNDMSYKEWRIMVWKRDRFKCKINNEDCSGKIVAHHILPWSKFPELRYEVNNGITLCQHHHPRKRNDEIRLIPEFNKLVEVRVN